jgi:23S rRNA G2445 N2-methylase RlmL
MVNVGVLVNKGFESVVARQCKELLGYTKNVEVNEGIVSFDAKDWDDVYRFVYRTQIANRVLYLLGNVEYDSNETLITNISNLINESKDNFLTDLINTGNMDFRVSIKVDEHTDVTYLEAEVGGVFFEYAKSLNKPLKVNLKNPILNIYIYMCGDMESGKAYVGIDLSDELSKRDYKIFNNAVSLKGTSAFGLLMMSGYNSDEGYLNPCCYSGTMEIEAGLYVSNTSHRFYNKSFPFTKLSNAVYGTNNESWDKFFKRIDSERISNDGGLKREFSITGSDKLLSGITASVKNAKIAGVESFINFRRIDLDWMDIKFEEKSVDRIITFIPGSSKHDKSLPKEYKELFYQAEYILQNSRKESNLIIMCLSTELLLEASKEYFILSREHVVYSGSQEMHILFFNKKKKSANNETKDDKN